MLVFASVAFGERWMYVRPGVMGANLVWGIIYGLLLGAGLSTLLFNLNKTPANVL